MRPRPIATLCPQIEHPALPPVVAPPAMAHSRRDDPAPKGLHAAHAHRPSATFPSTALRPTPAQPHLRRNDAIRMQAFASGDDCTIVLDVTGGTTPNPPVQTNPTTRPPPPVVPPPPRACSGACAPAGRKCAGRNFPVSLECCDPGQQCVARDANFAQCRDAGRPGLFGWDGSTVPCGVPGP